MTEWRNIRVVRGPYIGDGSSLFSRSALLLRNRGRARRASNEVTGRIRRAMRVTVMRYSLNSSEPLLRPRT